MAYVMKFSSLVKFEKIGISLIFVGIVFLLVTRIAYSNLYDDDCYSKERGEFCQICEDIDDESECVANDNCEYGIDDDLGNLQLIWTFLLVFATSVVQYLAVRLKASADSPSTKHAAFPNLALVSITGFGFTVILSIVYSYIADPDVEVDNWSDAFSNGFDCYRGENSMTGEGCVDDDCWLATAWTNIFFAVNVLYQLTLYRIYEERADIASDILLISLSLTVPLCSIAFSLPFFPTVGDAPDFDTYVSLILIVVGLIVFRKGAFSVMEEDKEEETERDGESMRQDVSGVFAHQ